MRDPPRRTLITENWPDGDEPGRCDEVTREALPVGRRGRGPACGTRQAGPDGGVLILAAVPIGRAEDASRGWWPSWPGEPDRGRGHPPGALAGVEPEHRAQGADRLLLRRGRGAAHAELLGELQVGQDTCSSPTPGPGSAIPATGSSPPRPGRAASDRPGPSAVTTALAVSGLPTDRYQFRGVPPRGPGQRARRFAELAEDRRTQVLFESGRRLAATLAELAASHGADRPAVVCRALTKTHEEIKRGTLAGLAQWAALVSGDQRETRARERGAEGLRCRPRRDHPGRRPRRARQPRRPATGATSASWPALPAPVAPAASAAATDPPSRRFRPASQRARSPPAVPD